MSALIALNRIHNFLRASMWSMKAPTPPVSLIISSTSSRSFFSLQRLWTWDASSPRIPARTFGMMLAYSERRGLASGLCILAAGVLGCGGS